MSSPFRFSPNGIEFFIKITPNAASNSIGGLVPRDFEVSSTPRNDSTKGKAKGKTGKVGISAEESSLSSHLGDQQLEVKVTAPPDKGKANSFLLRLISKEFRIPLSDISIASGATSRNKKLLIDPHGNPTQVIQALSLRLSNQNL